MLRSPRHSMMKPQTPELLLVDDEHDDKEQTNAPQHSDVYTADNTSLE